MEPPTAKPAAPSASPAMLAPPANPLAALRVSQEAELSSSEFGRELLRKTKALREKTYVAPPTVLPGSSQWNCPVCDSTWFTTMERKTKDGKALPRNAVAPSFKGHEDHEPYCVSCVTEWVQVKVSEMNPVIPCLNPTCKKELTIPDLQPHLPANVLKSLDNVQLLACITAMKDIRYCPVCNSCGYLSHPGCFDGECRECGWSFCASCLLGKHPAIRCSVAVHQVDPAVQRKFWESRVNQVWIRDHTKPCPKCSVPIEKGEGCSHMTCKKCSHQFCWICLGPYRGVYVTGGAANGSVCPCPPPDPVPAAKPAAAAPVAALPQPAAAAAKNPQAPAAAAPPAGAPVPTPAAVATPAAAAPAVGVTVTTTPAAAVPASATAAPPTVSVTVAVAAVPKAP